MAENSRSWIFRDGDSRLPTLDASISRHYLADEAQTVRFLLDQARLPAAQSEAVGRTARRLVKVIRENQKSAGGLDAFMNEYDLSSSEGIVLMCLAEALLRIPDAETADRLIADKLGEADWAAHLGSGSLFVNASTWALMLTGRIVRLEPGVSRAPGAFVARLIERLGEPVVRAALKRAMRILGHQFVMGETIEEALERAGRGRRYSYSFDMLGEAALTVADAERYYDAYLTAIEAIGRHADPGLAVIDAPGISVKLSALSPRFEYAQSERALAELSDRLAALTRAARDARIGLTVDAEEADRLELTLAVFERVLLDPGLAGYAGLGIAVQAYQKRAWHVVQWLEELAQSVDRMIPVRLVKGAYWDTEIKRAQQLGLDSYPVFTRKSSTDVSYLACAKALLLSPHLYPQFATHNAHAAAWLLEVGSHRHFEFQRLHGMGEALYGELGGVQPIERPCRVYAPVGSHEDLLPYLVRRLLENGANTSFVNRLIHAEASIDTITADPVVLTEQIKDRLPHPRIPLPSDLFGAARVNSRGFNLTDSLELERLEHALVRTAAGSWHACPIVDGVAAAGLLCERLDPADRARKAGNVEFANSETARRALDTAARFAAEWNRTPAAERARCLRRAADLYEDDSAELIARCVAETGKTIPDSVGEVREAVDFLRYYAAESERLLERPDAMPGPTGEHNELRLIGRGVFFCVSPWNFPLAIFTGQVAAALAGGNTVLAKPAEQASLVAARAIELLGRAGIPPAALQFLPGDGAAIGAAVLDDPRLAGVAFTGSVPTAAHIQMALARRDAPMPVLIAETGGVNAMIADSSALPEQIVRDVVRSAFNSAGQRCSALRLLCLHEPTADRVLEMLLGNMEELVVGDPALLSTDVGPVIDDDALRGLTNYVASCRDKIIYQCKLGPEHRRGTFFPPTVIRLESAAELTREVFGPVLHVVRYGDEPIETLVDAINATGFGLTLGVHSRVDSFARAIARRARVGNVYVNRDMIGAQVGVQPFGGMGLSGTGPKAGGPHYLPRFLTEQTYTVNTAAVGGNATLLSMADEEPAARELRSKRS